MSWTLNNFWLLPSPPVGHILLFIPLSNHRKPLWPRVIVQHQNRKTKFHNDKNVRSFAAKLVGSLLMTGSGDLAWKTRRFTFHTKVSSLKQPQKATYVCVYVCTKSNSQNIRAVVRKQLDLQGRLCKEKSCEFFAPYGWRAFWCQGIILMNVHRIGLSFSVGLLRLHVSLSLHLPEDEIYYYLLLK